MRRTLGAGTALLLAPMATLTHAGLRTLVDEFGGCDLAVSEMISAEALLAGTQYEPYYTRTEPDPSRLIFQLVGYSQDALVNAAAILARTDAAGIDVNMGCSAPHIVRKGGGIAWMADASRAESLVARLRRITDTKSVSIKLRLGVTDDPDALLTFCTRMAGAGVDFVTLHPKSRRDGASRPARWSYVRMLREEIGVTIVGNGGITGAETLQARIDEAGAGPVMIGRAAARAPWVFAYLKQRMAGGGEYGVDLARTAARFFELLEHYQPQDFLATRAARFASYFTGNLTFGHSLGARLAQCRSYERIKDELLAYFRNHPDTVHYRERG